MSSPPTAVGSTAHTGESMAAYLNAYADRTVAHPVAVRIGRKTYHGAEYRQTRDHSPGSRAYADAVAFSLPLTYEVHAIQLAGELPASYVNGNARAGYVDADGLTWSVSCWWSPTMYGPDGVLKGGAVAHVREPDGSTRPWTIDDVRAYHYADGAVPTFDLMPYAPTNRYGEPYSVAPMKIEITREVAPPS